MVGHFRLQNSSDWPIPEAIICSKLGVWTCDPLFGDFSADPRACTLRDLFCDFGPGGPRDSCKWRLGSQLWTPEKLVNSVFCSALTKRNKPSRCPKVSTKLECQQVRSQQVGSRRDKQLQACIRPWPRKALRASRASSQPACRWYPKNLSGECLLSRSLPSAPTCLPNTYPKHFIWSCNQYMTRSSFLR